MSEFIQYSGMTYEQASREAERILQRDGWYRSMDRLIVLRRIMDQERRAARQEFA